MKQPLMPPKLHQKGCNGRKKEETNLALFVSFSITYLILKCKSFSNSILVTVQHNGLHLVLKMFLSTRPATRHSKKIALVFVRKGLAPVRRGGWQSRTHCSATIFSKLTREQDGHPEKKIGTGWQVANAQSHAPAPPSRQACSYFYHQPSRSSLNPPP